MCKMFNYFFDKGGSMTPKQQAITAFYKKVGRTLPLDVNDALNELLCALLVGDGDKSTHRDFYPTGEVDAPVICSDGILRCKHTPRTPLDCYSRKELLAEIDRRMGV